MKRFFILTFITLFALTAGASVARDGVKAVNSCFGAMNIFANGEYNLQFTGKKSDGLINGYSSLKNISRNQLWCSFIATSTGDLYFDANGDF